MSPAPVTETPFLRLASNRWSCRAFDPNRPVPRPLVDLCLEAARQAPSACNRQPWHFVLAEEEGVRAALFEQARLPGIAHKWWRDVPLFAVLCVELGLVTHRIAPAISGIPYYLLDLGIAGEHFVLAAAEQGLATCWIGWFREKAVKRILSIPRSVRAVSLIAVGYAADDQGRSSGRKTADEFVHWDGW